MMAVKFRGRMFISLLSLRWCIYFLFSFRGSANEMKRIIPEMRFYKVIVRISLNGFN